MKKIVLAGGTGFLGNALESYFLKKGLQVSIISRSKGNIWDGKTLGEWTHCLENAYAIINLAGKAVDCRYTDSNKKEILNSRIDSTKILAKAISSTKNPPKVWINSSTSTIYENTVGDAKANCETSTHIGNDFSMTIAKRWESAFSKLNSQRRSKLPFVQQLYWVKMVEHTQ